MPLVRIDVIEGRSDADLEAIGDAVHNALIDCFAVPRRDRFQVITEHRRGRLIYDPAYLDIPRTDGIVIIQVVFATGRTPDQKQTFYAYVANAIAERTRTRKEDVMVSLVENGRGDWSFGNGKAQYLTLPTERWN
jgi:phenylpyruvate tautomerase PptA (4-oxalocrotonate tautomerase family)